MRISRPEEWPCKFNVYRNLKEIIGLAHANKLLPVIFKPADILDFVVEEAEPEWPQEKVTAILDALKPGNQFEDQNMEDLKLTIRQKTCGNKGAVLNPSSSSLAFNPAGIGR